MIDLMLDAGGQKFVRLFLEGVAVPVQGLDAYPGRALYLLVKAGDRQAALFIRGQLIRERCDLRVDENPRLGLIFGQVHHDQPLMYVHLSGRQTDARAGVHGFEHVVDEFAKLVIYLFHRLCYRA